MRNPCICQICICGRHHCEHRKTRVPFARDSNVANIVTEYKERFKPSIYTRAVAFKPPDNADWKLGAGPLGMSLTKSDFKSLPLQKTTKILLKDSYQKPMGRMESTSMYKQDYKPTVRQEIRTSMKPPECLQGSTGKMESGTTYKLNYKPQMCLKREPPFKTKGNLTTLGLPFMGDTETRISYIPLPYSKPEAFDSKINDTLKPGGAFDGRTMHKTDYVATYQVPIRPIKKVSKWQPNQGQFFDVTTHDHDFPAHQVVRVKPFEPKKGQIEIIGPFQGISKYKEDFKPICLPERVIPQWHPSQKKTIDSLAPFFGKTTYKTDYHCPPECAQPITGKKIPNNITLAKGPMEKLTTAMRDFQAIGNHARAISFKPSVEYKKPEGEITDHTTTRDDYKAQKLDKLKAFSKPPDNLKITQGPMADKTTTADAYQSIQIDCPARYLKQYGKDALEPEFTFDQTFRGHDYFLKLKPGQCCPNDTSHSPKESENHTSHLPKESEHDFPNDRGDSKLAICCSRDSIGSSLKGSSNRHGSSKGRSSGSVRSSVKGFEQNEMTKCGTSGSTCSSVKSFKKEDVKKCCSSNSIYSKGSLQSVEVR